MNYHTITKNDIVNGDGLRVTLWVSGCSHKCDQCQNPITWDQNNGILFDEEAKQEIFDELNHDYVDGITFSGGDPLFISNRETIADLVKEIKEKYPDKTIWLYSGYSFEEIDKSLLNSIDVLVDGEFKIDMKNSLSHYKGSTNQRVINVQESLKTNTVVLYCK